MRPIYLVVFVNVLFVVTAFVLYDLGQSYAPEIMASEAVGPPLVTGLVMLACWVAYWSVRRLKRAEKKSPDQVR